MPVGDIFTPMGIFFIYIFCMMASVPMAMVFFLFIGMQDGNAWDKIFNWALWVLVGVLALVVAAGI